MLGTVFDEELWEPRSFFRISSRCWRWRRFVVVSGMISRPGRSSSWRSSRLEATEVEGHPLVKQKTEPVVGTSDGLLALKKLLHEGRVAERHMHFWREPYFLLFFVDCCFVPAIADRSKMRDSRCAGRGAPSQTFLHSN